jgi:hypothetical protein
MWNMKGMIIPVTAGGIGIVTEGLNKNLEAIPVHIQQIRCKRQLHLEHHR